MKCLPKSLEIMIDISVSFDAAWVLARLAALNHKVHLCQGASLAWCRRAPLMTLDNAEFECEKRSFRLLLDARLYLRVI